MNEEALRGKVLGTCTLQKVIGRGGMGAVFLAQQSRPRRQVAVKVFLPMTTLDPRQLAAFLERFRRETDAAAALEHPNIIPVHEYGELDGLAYLVMPYVSGGTLRDELDREGKLPLTQIVSYVEQIAGALDFAHERGVIHRDIKPANILLTPEKRIFLTDFGLVKIVTEGHISQNPLSEVGTPMGTPDYMSPEQVVGRDIDARADIYSFGILIYHMVTGAVPFKGDIPMKVAMHHLHTPPPPPRTMRPDLPLEAEAAILRAIAKRPEDRYSTARELAQDFRQALEAAGVMLDMQGGTAAMQAIHGERNNAGRPRSLFDPVWRNATATKQSDQPAHPTHKTPSKVVEPVEEVEIVQKKTISASAQEIVDAAFAQVPFENAAVYVPALVSDKPSPLPGLLESKERLQHDIVATTSMTLPSFSGLLVSTQQVPVKKPQPIAVAQETGTSEQKVSDMENQPKRPVQMPFNAPSPFPPTPEMQTREDAAAANKSFLASNRFRTNSQRDPFDGKQGALFSNPQGSRGSQPAQGTQQPFGSFSVPQFPQGQQPQQQSFPGQQLAFGQAPQQNMWGQQPNPASPFPNIQAQGMPGTDKANGLHNWSPAAGPASTFSPTSKLNNPADQSGSGMATGRIAMPGVQPAANGFTSIPGMSAAAAPTNVSARPSGALNSAVAPRTGNTGALPRRTGQTGALNMANGPQTGMTGSLMIPSEGSTGQTGMLKLTQSVKVVKVPVAGQPGQYVTGLLPVLQPLPDDSEATKQLTPQQRLKKRLTAIMLVVLLLLIVGGSGFYFLTRPGGSTGLLPNRKLAPVKANVTATALAQASATAQANLIVSDPLQIGNAHGWLVGQRDNQDFEIKADGYHIANNNPNQSATALLPDETLDSFVYKVTVAEINGEDNSTDSTKQNFFGLILRFNQDGDHKTFYCFEVLLTKNKKQYEFRKYDNGNNVKDPWKQLWKQDIGDEYHQDHGFDHANTMKVVANGDKFTFFVNDKQVGDKSDGDYKQGQIGMMVNLAGVEVAYKDLLVTHN